MLKIESRYVNRVHLDLKFQISHLYQYPALRNKNDHLDLLLESIWTWSFKFCIFIIFSIWKSNYHSQKSYHWWFYDQFYQSPFQPKILNFHILINVSFNKISKMKVVCQKCQYYLDVRSHNFWKFLNIKHQHEMVI